VNTNHYIEAIAQMHDQHRERMKKAATLYDDAMTKMMEEFIKAAMDAERDLEDELTNLTRKL